MKIVRGAYGSSLISTLGGVSCSCVRIWRLGYMSLLLFLIRTDGVLL